MTDSTTVAPSRPAIITTAPVDTNSVLQSRRAGANALSVGRPSTDSAVLSRVRSTVGQWFEQEAPTRD